jgi:large subunit ribosomal protein L6
MSRVGKQPIIIPTGTSVKLESGFIVVKGPKGELKQFTHPQVVVTVNENEALITVKDETDKKQRSLWGLYRNLINNMVLGVNTPFTRKMEIKGVGYKAAVAGQKIIFNLGFSHPIDFPLPQGISATLEGNFLTISGIDKQLVGEMAAQIRRLREPEPYKGKGIKYDEEIVRRKAGKTAASK